MIRHFLIHGIFLFTTLTFSQSDNSANSPAKMDSIPYELSWQYDTEG